MNDVQLDTYINHSIKFFYSSLLFTKSIDTKIYFYISFSEKNLRNFK